MAFRTVQIGSDIYRIPIEGTSAPWGQEVSDFLIGVADALGQVQGPNDILITSATLANNQSSAANIPGLVFSAGTVQAIDVTYLITRVYDGGASTIAESGKILGNYDGTTFSISQQFVGNSGVLLSILNSGQMQYTSSNLASHVSTTIKFSAKTIDA